MRPTSLPEENAVPLSEFLRFPSDKDADKYQYERTANTVVGILAAAGLCVVFLSVYATVRSSLFLILAGCSAGLAVTLWFLTKPPVDEEP